MQKLDAKKGYIYILRYIRLGMKIHQMLSCDSELIEEAKKRGFVLSDIMNQAMRERLRPMKKDFSEENLILICKNCKKKIKSGFRCEYHKMALCAKCEEDWPRSKCKHLRGEHIHAKFGEEDSL